MKAKLFSSVALFAALTLSVSAGVDSKDMKDAKDVKDIAPVSESDAGFYVALQGGSDVLQNYSNNHADYSAPGVSARSGVHTSTVFGSVGGLKVGYNFNSFELAGNFRLQPAVEFDGYYLGTQSKNTSSIAGATTESNDTLDAGAMMINGILRLKTGTFATPYIGVGVGTEYLSYSNVSFSTTGGLNPSNTSDSSFALAAQALAGSDFKLTDHISLFLEYKFLAAIEPSSSYDNVVTSGDRVKNENDFIGQHIAVAGIKYNF